MGGEPCPGIPGFPTIILVPGTANQDDYIGYGVAVFNFEQILSAGKAGLPIEMELNQNWDGLPRYLQTDDPESIYYKIEGRIRVQ